MSIDQLSIVAAAALTLAVTGTVAIAADPAVPKKEPRASASLNAQDRGKYMLIVGSWGVSFRVLGNRNINPPLWLFLLMLGGIIPMYLAARAALPDQLLEEGVDLKAHYHAVSHYLWLSIAVSFLIYVLWDAFRGGMTELAKQWLILAQLLFVVPLIVSRRRRVHELAVPVIVVLFCLHHLNEPLFR